MKTADQILAEHEDANEMHFRQVDREWLIKAMDEYAASRMPWIRPQDQMPEDNKPVLITDVEGLQIIAWYVADLDRWYSENHYWFTHEINYWMPIPEIV
jgi:hypothetical protein